MALVVPTELSIDKDRTELISLEILKFSEDVGNTDEMDIAEIKELYSKLTEEEFIKVDDLSQPYVIRVVTSKESILKSLEPDFLPNGDDFEVSETIQEILKGKNINVYGADFKTEDLEHAGEIKKARLSDAIKQEMANGITELNKVTGEDNIKIAKVDEVGPSKNALGVAKMIEDAEIIDVPVMEEEVNNETDQK